LEGLVLVTVTAQALVPGMALAPDHMDLGMEDSDLEHMDRVLARLMVLESAMGHMDINK
jgi:hypothetical protein